MESKTCSVCGKKMEIILEKNGNIPGGVFFGTIQLPIGDGEWKKIGVSNIGEKFGMDYKIDVVEWTGEEKEVEYWECGDCYTEATDLDEDIPQKSEG